MIQHGREFLYAPEKHEYRLDGRLIPHVTGVLRDVGIIDPTWYTEYARERGSAVHKCCHFLDEADLNWSSVDPKIEGYVRAYEKFLKETGFKPMVVEVPTFHKVLEYGVTPDAYGELGDGMVVVERKSGTLPKWVGLQLAAQAMAIEPGNWMVIGRLAVEIHGDGTYRLEWCRNRQDGAIFTSALAVANWKGNGGTKG